MISPLIDELMKGLRLLPGVGPKSAQRMALHLLERNREGAKHLAHCLLAAAEKVTQCSLCRTLTEQPLCGICASTKRDQTLICVVESPADVLAIELSGQFFGKYFVLHGHLSPIDGIGPKELGIDILMQRLNLGIEELIVATNLTMEGEATAHYIAEHAKPLGIRVTRIAHGVPMGGELEHIDGGTLAHALVSRRNL